jgi:hypothetical protein
VCHRTVRCTREINSELATFGNSRSHSAIIHRTVRCAKRSNGYLRQRSSAMATVNSEQCRLRAQNQIRRQMAHRTVNSACPVHHRTVRWPTCQKLQRSTPNDRVTWLAHRTVRCAIRQQPSATTILVVGTINTPQPPHFNASKFSAIKPHTRAIDFIPRHKHRDQIPSQVRNHSKQISDLRERLLCSFELLRLDCFSSSSILVSNSIVIKARDTKLWWSL